MDAMKKFELRMTATDAEGTVTVCELSITHGQTVPGACSCVVEFLPFFSPPREIYGVSPEQAFELAMKFSGAMFELHASELVFRDESGSILHTLPVPA